MRDLASFCILHILLNLISSACVLFGFQKSVCDVSASNQSVATGCIAGRLTLLLALTAIAIVRLGIVWEDARTVALLAHPDVFWRYP